MSAIPKIDLQKIRVEDVYPFIRDLSVKLPFLIVLFSKVCINGTMYTTECSCDCNLVYIDFLEYVSFSSCFRKLKPEHLQKTLSR